MNQSTRYTTRQESVLVVKIVVKNNAPYTASVPVAICAITRSFYEYFTLQKLAIIDNTNILRSKISTAELVSWFILCVEFFLLG